MGNVLLRGWSEFTTLLPPTFRSLRQVPFLSSFFNTVPMAGLKALLLGIRAGLRLFLLLLLTPNSRPFCPAEFSVLSLFCFSTCAFFLSIGLVLARAALLSLFPPCLPGTPVLPFHQRLSISACLFSPLTLYNPDNPVNILSR